MTILKLTAADPDTKSADILADNIAQLKTLFPEACTEGKIDFEVLKQLLGGAIDEREERYGLNWHGKRRARQLALNKSTGTLLPCPEDSVDWDSTQNLMIEGDNLEVLKLLQKSYAGKVKLIYIDPPYNTGKDFVYPDNFRDNIKNYLELTGQVEGGQSISSNTEASGRFHTDWLNMMYPRLKLARDFLADEGLIFISIDDHELNNIITICDDIYGQENRVEIFCWQKTTTPSNLSNQTKKSIEYIVCYEKNRTLPLVGAQKKSVSTNGLMNQPNQVGTLKFPQNTIETGMADGKYPAGRYGTSSYEIDLLQDVTVKDGVFTSDVVLRGKFKWSQAYLEEQIKKGVMIYIKTSTFSPSYEKKEYENEKPWNIINKSYEVGTNENASSELDNLYFTNFSENMYPKPTSLLKFIIQMCNAYNDIVMDFFAGTASFGHACILHNAENKSNTRYILVQLPEPLDPEKKDQKTAADFCDSLNKPRNIAELTKERLRRAGRKVKADNPDFKGDTGFRVFKLAPSNIRAWNPDRDDLEQNLLDYTNHLEPGRSEQDLLYELLLKRGLDLCVPIETKQIADKTVRAIGGGVMFACLADGITRDVVDPLADGIVAWRDSLQPEGDVWVLFKDAGFVDDVAKTNMAELLKQRGISAVQSL